ncbi:MAG: phosphatase PAP2 family protein [Chlorobiaceae bacterium]|nr:phosphatase PAP2 family protein [Chlorobiaceae bacterium]
MGLFEQMDAWLFRFLNHNLVHPAVDDLMLFVTNPKLSLHVIVLALLFIFFRKGKEALFIFLLLLLAVGIADFTASGIMKPLFQRVRPCFALDGVRLLLARQTHSWSFASSHAANSTAIASLVWIFFWHGELVDKVYTALIIVYALMISFSRIYIGVHYPGDVLGGMLVGLFSATLVYTAASWTVKNVVHRRLMQKGAAEE